MFARFTTPSLSTPSRPQRARRIRTAPLAFALAAGPLLMGLMTPQIAAAGPVAGVGTPAAAKVVTAFEQTESGIPMSEVIAKSVPAELPAESASSSVLDSTPIQQGAPEFVAGIAAGSALDARAGTATSTATGSSIRGNVWPGAFNSNPNRQVGKLYFDRDPGPGVTWSHCTATAINTPNKSMVLTAGHCVFNSDPDQNGRVDGNGYYYQDFRFCPGYEDSCKLGVWYYRMAATTPNWYYGLGANHTYDWSDDIAVLLMKPNTTGYLVNVVGGQGITFNQPVGQMRTAFGYPAPDTRWPQYKFSGQDLIYCQGVDTLSTSRTKIRIPCRMTGGASGGPWLIGVNAQWGGYVNSVNSHKPYGAEYMEGPYFGNAEANLYNKYKSA